jgi:pyridoxine 5-phosphate synthase
VRNIRPIITTEFNIEGNPTEQKFVDLVLETRPQQVTLVPDALGQITSNHGWDTVLHQAYLTGIIALFKAADIRVSIFVDPIAEMIAAAASTGTDRVELYTESYAKNFGTPQQQSTLNTFAEAAKLAQQLGMGVNAGHDLDRYNLQAFATAIPFLAEVSIGHALICDALYLGLENTIQIYKRQLGPAQ